MQGVSAAVETLKGDGTIAALSDKYLSQEQPLADLPQCNSDTWQQSSSVLISIIASKLAIEFDRDAAAYIGRHSAYGL